MYRVRTHNRRVDRELDSLSPQTYDRIAEAISALANDPRPRGTIKLGDNIYRVRVGNYRIIYLIDDVAQLVSIGAVRRRNEATYRRPDDLFRP